MSTSASTMAYLLDQLSGAGPISARRMFGEYCLYYAGRPVGLVCDEQLFLKPTARNKALLANPSEGAPFPGARPHLRLSADDWEDRQLLGQLVRITFEDLPPPKLAQAKKEAKATKATKATKGAAATQPAAARAALDTLPNLGPRSVQMLADAGIHSVAELRKLGPVAAYARVKRCSPSASLNLLWALEGALSNLPWQLVARDHRTSLLLALEQHMLGARG